MKSLRNIQALALAALALAITATGASAQAVPTAIGYNATNSNPYYYVGRLSTAQGSGSATVIKASSVLTAGHVIYSRAGWSTNVLFERARYFNNRPQNAAAYYLYVLSGYAPAVAYNANNSNIAFANDLGGVLCSTRPASGYTAGWWANPVLLTNTSYKMSLGYGAVQHSGLEMLRSAPSRSFVTSQSYGAYFWNYTYSIHQGMSGGPLFVYQNNGWYVAGVNVSGSATVGGVRALDLTASNFINSYLR